MLGVGVQFFWVMTLRHWHWRLLSDVAAYSTGMELLNHTAVKTSDSFTLRHLLLWRNSPIRVWAASMLLFLDHTHTHTHTPGSTPLNEWPARRRGLYLHNTQQTQEMHIRTLSGIRTHDPSNQVTADLRLWTARLPGSAVACLGVAVIIIFVKR